MGLDDAQTKGVRAQVERSEARHENVLSWEGVSEAKTEDENDRLYETTKRRYLGAAGLVALGLGVAGTLDRTTGGVIVLVGWIAGIFGLHRLGRAGSAPRP